MAAGSEMAIAKLMNAACFRENFVEGLNFLGAIPSFTPNKVLFVDASPGSAGYKFITTVIVGGSNAHPIHPREGSW